MNKLGITLFGFLVIIFYALNGYAQVEMIGDTIQLEVNGYKGGNIQWQFSTDKQNWIDIPNANKKDVKHVISQTAFFRSKIADNQCQYVSDETFIYTTSIDKTYPRIIDENSNIKIQWNFNIPASLIKKQDISIEGEDTTIVVPNNLNELLIPRKMEYYNKLFTINAVTTWGVELPKQTIRYDNNFNQFFTCKNKYMAHRGLSNLYPENTAIAFEKAAEKKFEYVECDIWLTKDHQWVVIHDETIDRTSNNSGKICDYTFEELQNFNFGYPKLFKTQYPQKILTLEQFVDLCKRLNIKSLIEIKQSSISDDDLKKMITIVTETLPVNKFVFHSFNLLSLNAIRRINKEIVLGITSSTYKQTHITDLKNLYPCFYNLASGAVNLDQPFNKTSNQNIFTIYTSGTFVCVWTVDDSKYFDNLTNNNLFILTNTLPPQLK